MSTNEERAVKKPSTIVFILVALANAGAAVAQHAPGAHRHADHPGHTPDSQPSPVPPLTDRDRSAVYLSEAGHTVHDNAIVSFWLLDQLEWRDADDGEAVSWNATGWIGNDIDRLWWRTEGERSDGVTETAELQLLWGHAIGPWWEFVAGLRQDFKPGSPQTWGAIGVQGMALYNFEAEATLYVGEGGQTAARLEGGYDILLTNRLILQPAVEVNLHGRDDPQRSIGSGLGEVEIGLRLRYEIRRELAPYIGLRWTRHYGETADLARAAGGSVEDTELVIGIRAWY
jgi:copper resistance protein B